MQLTGSVLVKRKSWKARMDPGRDPTAGLFSGLIVAGTVYIWCTKRSGPFDIVSYMLFLLYLVALILKHSC